MHRPNPSQSNVTEILVWKCRFSWVGAIGECELEYDSLTSRYNKISDVAEMLKPKKSDKQYDNYYEPKEYKDISF